MEYVRLTNLVFLDLGHSPLGGTLSAASLAAWSSLTYANLQSLSLSGTIPSTVGLLTALTSLALSSNRLSGSVPSELGSLAALGVLTGLGLDGNAFTGQLDSRLLGILGLCTSTSQASAFGSPGLTYACPGQSVPAPSSSPSQGTPTLVIIGAAVGGGAGCLVVAAIAFSSSPARNARPRLDRWRPPPTSSCTTPRPRPLTAISAMVPPQATSAIPLAAAACPRMA